MSALLGRTNLRFLPSFTSLFRDFRIGPHGLRQMSGSLSAESKQTKSSHPKTGSIKKLKTYEDFRNYRERYIPITRKSIVRHLVEETNFLTDNEKKKFEKFAASLDAAVVNRYVSLLQELKELFDPINPDKDTIQTRKWTRRERLDNEFWLVRKLEDVAEKANFHELSAATLQRAMKEHDTTEGVRVSVNPKDYEILKVWALGREKSKLRVPWYKFILRWKHSAGSGEYFKRVLVAMRLKKDNKLLLKSFKEVPVNALEMLLPTGKIRMQPWDKLVISLSSAMAFVSMMIRAIIYESHLPIDPSVLVGLFSVMIAGRTVVGYNSRRNRYLGELSRMLYYKNIANNQSLLASLVARAEDETFKELLMTYTFLLTQRPPSAREADNGYYQRVHKEISGCTKEEVENWAESWIQMKTGAKVQFDSSEAISLLAEFGILDKKKDKMNVLSLEAAMCNLPQQPNSVISRGNISDLGEGYDRDEFLETGETFEQERERSKNYSWGS